MRAEVFFGSVCRIPGKVSDLICNDSEALSGNTGSGRLHGGVKCQNIRLERNGFNGFNDVADLSGAAADFVHGGDHALHLQIAGVHLIADPAGFLTGLLRVGGIAPDLSGDVSDKCSQPFDGTRLFGGALREGLGAGGYLFRTARYLIGGTVDLSDNSI